MFHYSFLKTRLPGSSLFHWTRKICIRAWYAMCFRDKLHGGFKEEHVKCCSATTKSIMSPLPTFPNLAWWWLTIRGLHPQSYSAFWSRDLARSRDTLELLYLYNHNGYGHQTCHGGVLSWGAFTHKATWPMVKWQTKTIVSPLSKCLWPPNLAEWWLMFRGLCSKSYMIFWSHGLARSREKLKPLYPH